MFGLEVTGGIFKYSLDPVNEGGFAAPIELDDSMLLLNGGGAAPTGIGKPALPTLFTCCPFSIISTMAISTQSNFAVAKHSTL